MESGNKKQSTNWKEIVKLHLDIEMVKKKIQWLFVFMK
jgi:hypothetical protein